MSVLVDFERFHKYNLYQHAMAQQRHNPAAAAASAVVVSRFAVAEMTENDDNDDNVDDGVDDEGEGGEEEEGHEPEAKRACVDAGGNAAGELGESTDLALDEPSEHK